MLATKFSQIGIIQNRYYSTGFIPVIPSTHQAMLGGPRQSQRKLGVVWESIIFNDIYF